MTSTLQPRGTSPSGLDTAAVVGAAMASVPFYAAHLRGFETAALDRLPTFHKAMTAGYGAYPLSVAPASQAHRVVATSGTTGDRLFVAFDRHDWDRVGGWLARVGSEAGLGPGDALLNTHCYGLWVGGPALDLLAARADACLIPLGPTAPSVVLAALADGIGTAISATPSYLRRLVEAADATGFDLRSTRLRLGFIGAEPAEDSLRRKLVDCFPPAFRWIELYGLTETAGPRLACAPDPDVPELVVNTDDFLIEVLDPTSDGPVGVGAVGELTITTKDPSTRTPLIRYRTRDLVRATAEDRDGVRRLSRILGRADDAMKIGGVLMYPSAVAEVVSGVLPASAEWRAIVRPRGDEHELIVEAEADDASCRDLRRAFDERVGLHARVVATPAGEFVRSREKTRRTIVESPAAPPSDQVIESEPPTC